MIPPAPSRRHLLLILGGDGGDAKSAALVAASRHCFHQAHASGPAAGTPTAPGKPRAEDALCAWLRIGSELGPACLGVVAGRGAPGTAAAGIVARGARDGMVPGAVALLGYQPELVEACLRLTAGQDGERADGWGRPWAVRRATVDPPPVLILLAADDPSLAECASACRRLRAAGLDVRLEVTGPALSGPDASTGGRLDAGSVEELDAFFEANLEPSFPHMPQDTS